LNFEVAAAAHHHHLLLLLLLLHNAPTAPGPKTQQFLTASSASPTSPSFMGNLVGKKKAQPAPAAAPAAPARQATDADKAKLALKVSTPYSNLKHKP
jgi:hypothetical protein